MGVIMRYFHSTSTSEELSWAFEILAVVRDAGYDGPAAQIQAAISQFQAANFSLAVLGKVKRGKSTLINALLGRKDDLAAPIDKLPASSTVSHFRWSEKEKVVVHYRDGRHDEVPLEQVRGYATEELNPGNSKMVELLDIAGPFEGLEDRLELVDTPGAGSLHDHHDALLHAFIPQADAVIFLVSAQMPLDQDELDLLKKIKDADNIAKIFFAINRIDEAGPEDLNAAEAHNRQLLEEHQIPVKKLYRISAKRAFEGNAAESGVPELLADVQEYLRTQKAAVIRHRLVSRVQLAAVPVAQQIQIEHQCSSKTREELIAEKDKLAVENARLQREQPLVEREFKNQWDEAIRGFQRELDSAEKSVRMKIVHQVQEIPLVQLNTLIRDLPTRLQDLVEKQLEQPRKKLESSLCEATQHLQATYPQLHNGDLEIYAFRSSEDATLAKGAVAGVATSVVGSGLVAAGGAMAASIATANAAAVTTTVAAPTAVGGFLTTLFPQAAGLVSTFLTGTASVAVPVAYTTTPLWVALSGPVGWTMIGVGTLAIPFAWRISKLKAKDKLVEAVKTQVDEVFRQIRDERVAHLKEIGGAIVEEFKLRSARQVSEIESMLEQLAQTPNDTDRIKQLAAWSAQLDTLLTQSNASETVPGGPR